MYSKSTLLYLNYTSSFNNLSNTMAGFNTLSDTMADAIDVDYSGSESEYKDTSSAGKYSSDDNSDSNDNNDDNNDGSLSPASAARIQESTRELDAIKKGKAKRRPRPSGLHLFSLKYFRSLSSVCPPRSFHSFSSSRFSHSASRASCDPPCCS